jgi:hypothetical protein
MTKTFHKSSISLTAASDVDLERYNRQYETIFRLNARRVKIANSWTFKSIPHMEERLLLKRW